MRFILGAQKVYGRCAGGALEGAWEVCGRCAEGTRKVRGRCTEGVMPMI